MKAVRLIIAVIFRIIFYPVAFHWLFLTWPFLTFFTTPDYIPNSIIGYDCIIRTSTGAHAAYADIALPNFIEEGRYGYYYVIDAKPSQTMYEIVTDRQKFEDIDVTKTASGETLVIMHGSKTEGHLGGNYQVGTRLDMLAENNIIDDQDDIVVVTCYPGDQEIYSHCTNARMYSDRHHGLVQTLKFSNKLVLFEVPEFATEVFTYVVAFL